MNFVVYEIRNIKTNKIYIGSTQNFKRRIGVHFSSLRNNTHHCFYLQRSFNKHGESCFVYSILFEFNNKIDMHLKEEGLLKDLTNKYNISNKSSGGNLITNHPKLDEIKNKHRENYYRLQKENGGVHPSISKFDSSGKNNPNYKHGNLINNKTCKNCGIKVSITATYCEPCYMKSRDYFGENNPFYGKTHSKETLDKIKNTKSKKTQRLPGTTIQVIIDDKIYESATKAAKEIKCAVMTIFNRCKSNKFPNYNFNTKEENANRK